MAAAESRTYTCPLCMNRFGGNGELCHSSCPMSHGCKMIKCPNCSYEYVEDSVVVDFFRKLFKRKPEELEPHA
jgi:hypothetical protein